MSEGELEEYEKNLPERELFKRHENIVISSQNGGLSRHLPHQGSSPNRRVHAVGVPYDSTPVLPSYNAFFIPRLNFFLGKYLRYGGVYPDGVIRLFKKGKAHLPCKDVHEIMEVEEKVGWLQNPLKHMDSPTFKRYLERNNRYIDLLAEELCHSREGRVHPEPVHCEGNPVDNIKLFFNYMFLKPISWFFMTTFRHKGILDGWQGVVFSLFSALRFPRAYWRATSNLVG